MKVFSKLVAGGCINSLERNGGITFNVNSQQSSIGYDLGSASLLLAGGGVGDINRSGLVTINLNFKDDLQDKVFGSANACSLLVEVLPKFMILMDYLDLQ